LRASGAGLPSGVFSGSMAENLLATKIMFYEYNMNNNFLHSRTGKYILNLLQIK
jgi:hypothetical protein